MTNFPVVAVPVICPFPIVVVVVSDVGVCRVVDDAGGAGGVVDLGITVPEGVTTGQS